MIVLKGSLNSEKGTSGLGVVYTPNIIQEDGFYSMYYSGLGRDGRNRIHLATSQNGLKWIKKGVILGNKYKVHVNDPSVVKMKMKGRVKYHMYYTTDMPNGIELAISFDGVKWTRKGIVITIGRQPSVLVDENNRFHMWYCGKLDVKYTTSFDGKIWVDHNVVMNYIKWVDVKKVENKFVMLYESVEGTGIAKSHDGILWEDHKIILGKEYITPVLVGEYIYCGVMSANCLRVEIGRYKYNPINFEIEL